MSDEISLETIDAQPTVAVTKRGPMAEVGKMMGEALKTADEYLREQGEEAVGPPFARYLSVEGESVTFEAGFPVKEPVAGNEVVRAAELPGGEVASVLHRGPYDSLDQTHELLKHWIDGQGRVPAGAPWEVYLTDPGEESDATKWETLVRWPVQVKAGDGEPTA